MLMLGESIFSLIIVDVPNESPAFGTTFYCGVLTVVMLMYVHYESEPHDPDSHAMRRSKDAGVIWSTVIHIYSLALVCLGAAFTSFLTHFAVDEKRRRLASDGDYDDVDSETQEESAAHLFCWSLAVIFACLDGMTALHIGFAEASKRLRTTEKNNAIVVALRAVTIPFIATVSLWETQPTRLSYIGLLCVFEQVLLRKLGNVYSNSKATQDSGEAESELEQASSPRNMRQSVLLASAWLNMTEEDLQALEDEDGASQEGGQNGQE